MATENLSTNTGPPTAGQILDDLDHRVRSTNGILGMLSCQDDDDLGNAAAAADLIVKEMGPLLHQLRGKVFAALSAVDPDDSSNAVRRVEFADGTTMDAENLKLGNGKDESDDDETDDDVGTDPRPEVITACNIYKEIEDAFATVEQFDLTEQPGASAEKLAAIEEMAIALSTVLNELCSSEHSSRDSNPEPAADVAVDADEGSGLREDVQRPKESAGDFTVPKVLGKLRPDADQWNHDAFMAALDHAKHLKRADSHVAEARALTETLRCALRSDDDYDPAYAGDVLGRVMDRLDKASQSMDKHSSRHTNLFVAYFAAKRD